MDWPSVQRSPQAMLDHAEPPEKNRFTPSKKPFSRGACLFRSPLRVSSSLRMSSRCSADKLTGVSITTRPAANRLHAFVAQAENASRLCLRGDLQGHVAFEGGHFNSAAQCGGRK